MTPSLNNQEDDFVADDFVADQEDDFVADEKPKEKKLEDLSWTEKHFTSEGQKLTSARNRNVGKGVVSGLTAGFSEMIPGFEVENTAEGVSGKIAGSLVPISAAAKAISYPLQGAAKALPKLARPIGALGNLLGISAAGGLYEGLEESAKKSKEAGEFVPPSPETIAAEGSKWAAIDIALNALGWGSRFARGLYNKSAELKKPVMDVLENITRQLKPGEEKVAEKALSILEDKPLKEIEKEALSSKKVQNLGAFGEEPVVDKVGQELRQKINVDTAKADLSTKKVKPEFFDKLSEKIEVKPYLPAEFEAEKISEKAMSEDLVQKIDEVAPRAFSDTELGKSIKTDVEASVKAAKAETDELYNIAKQVENKRTVNVKKTAESVLEQIKKIDAGGVQLTPEGYGKVKKQLMDVLTDLGYGVTTEGEAITGLMKAKDIPLSQGIEIKKRLNDIINYDVIESGAQDFLKNPAFNLRSDIRGGYGPKSSPARKAFEAAEEKFGAFAEKKGKKSIQNLRKSEKPESVSKLIKTPSGLADVKQVVSEGQFRQIERELLEHVKDLPHEKAAAFYREIRPQLNSDVKSIMEELIESKAPFTPDRKATQREKIQTKVIDDLGESTITGQRPKYTLDLWKTQEGQQLIKHALKNNPNKKEVLKFLEDQSFKDFYSSVVDESGKINFDKFNKLMKDKATVENIRMLAGQEGVDFLKNLEKLSERVSKNARLIENKLDKASGKERERINKELNKLGEERLNNKLAKKQERLDKQKEPFVKNEKLIEGKIDTSSAGKRKASEREIIKTGEQRLQDKISLREEKEAAKRAQEETGLIYKLDDLVSSYGWKGKGLLAALGIWKMGTGTAVPLAIGYEVFSRMAKSSTVRNAIKKAALPSSSPLLLIKSMLDIAEAEED